MKNKFLVFFLSFLLSFSANSREEGELLVDINGWPGAAAIEPEEQLEGAPELVTIVYGHPQLGTGYCVAHLDKEICFGPIETDGDGRPLEVSLSEAQGLCKNKDAKVLPSEIFQNYLRVLGMERIVRSKDSGSYISFFRDKAQGFVPIVVPGLLSRSHGGLWVERNIYFLPTHKGFIVRDPNPYFHLHPYFFYQKMRERHQVMCGTVRTIANGEAL